MIKGLEFVSPYYSVHSRFHLYLKVGIIVVAVFVEFVKIGVVWTNGRYSFVIYGLIFYIRNITGYPK